MSNDFRFAARVLRFVTSALVPVLLFVAAAKAADEDLPGRVGRVADHAGEIFLAPEDRATDWTGVGLNQPITTGDNLWVNGSGRAEIDYGGGQFRLAGDTNLHVSRLDDRELALFVAHGSVIVRVRVLDSGDAVSVDTPNTQLQLNRTGLYRVDVDPDRETTTLVVREGEATVSLDGGVQHAWPGQSVSVTGMGASYADVRSGAGVDGFDTWSANRDRHYERARSTAYVSRQMVGYADLDSYGTWETSATYGPVWYPTAVVADWAPYRFGHWTWISGFGYAWVDDAPWGYAPFHYGRWVHVGNRWGWCPGHYVARPVWAPALVGWYGGAGWSVSVNVGAPVYGWVPLAWGEAYHPWWGRCSNACWHRYNRPYAVNVVERPHRPPTTYVNVRAGAITAVAGATLAAAKPVASNRIPIRAGSPPPALAAAPPIRPLPVGAPAVRAGAGGAPAPASTLYQPKPRMAPTPAYSAPARDVPPAARTAPATAAPTRTAPVTRAPSAANPAAPMTSAPRPAERQRQVSQGAPVPPPVSSQPITAPAAPRVEPKPRQAPRQEGIPVPAPAAPARAVAPPPMTAAPPPPTSRAVTPAPPAPRAVAPGAPPAPSTGGSPRASTRGQSQPAAAVPDKPSSNPGAGPREAAR
jgi:hypothetical protein